MTTGQTASREKIALTKAAPQYHHDLTSTKPDGTPNADKSHLHDYQQHSILISKENSFKKTVWDTWSWLEQYYCTFAISQLLQCSWKPSAPPSRWFRAGYGPGRGNACEFFLSVMIGPVLCTGSCVYVNVSVSKQINHYKYALSRFLTDDDRENSPKNIVLQKIIVK